MGPIPREVKLPAEIRENGNLGYFIPMAGRKTAGEPKPTAADVPSTAGSLWHIAAAKSSHVSISAVFQQVMVRFHCLIEVIH